MKKEKKEEKKFKITELYTNKRYYAITNLVFYSCLILILIAMVRTNSSNNNTSGNSKNNNEIVEVKGFESIANKNFNFKYTVKLIDKEIVYSGKQAQNKMLFIEEDSKIEYFRQDDIILKNDLGNYVLTSNPNTYFDFFDVGLIQNILSVSEKDSKEYFISNKDFSSIVQSETLEETLYGVYIRVIKQNNIITRIIFDMSEYDKNIQSITLEYKNYGLIEDFEVK